MDSFVRLSWDQILGGPRRRSPPLNWSQGRLFVYLLRRTASAGRARPSPPQPGPMIFLECCNYHVTPCCRRGDCRRPDNLPAVIPAVEEWFSRLPSRLDCGGSRRRLHPACSGGEMEESALPPPPLCLPLVRCHLLPIVSLVFSGEEIRQL